MSSFMKALAFTGVAVSTTAAFTSDLKRNNDFVAHARLPPTRPLMYPPSADYPDLRKHNNIMKEFLTPSIYNKYRDVVSLSDS